MKFRRKRGDDARPDALEEAERERGSKKKERNRKEKANKGSSDPELAARLREYGENYGLEEDPYLEGLSNAIEEGKNLAIWASNDVMTLSHIAEDDFYIIGTVIVLTFITPFMNRSAVKKAAAFEQDALRERLSGGVASSCTSTTTPATPSSSEIFTCQIATPSVGTYSASATYNGDATYASQSSSTASVTVTAATPTITVAAPGALLGGTITYTATVTGPAAGSTPTGVVTWTLTGPAGATTTCPTSNPSAGASSNQATYTCTIPANPAGTYTAIATFNGNNADLNYTSVTSTPATSVSIAKITPTLTLSGVNSGGLYPPTLTFSATVTGSAGIAPSGVIGTNANWSITGPLTSCTSQPNGTAAGAVTTFVCTLTGATYGTYTVTLHYLGDANYSATDSNSTTLTISTLTDTIGAITKSAATLGGTNTLSVIVTGNPANGNTFDPAGSMNWTITKPDASTLSCTSQNVQSGFANGVATPLSSTYTCVIPTATAGTYTISATFPGDAHYNSASNNPATTTLSVAKTTPTINVTGIQSSTAGGQIITYTAVITGTTGSVAPTGALTWTVTGPIAAADSCTSNTGPSVTGVATTYTCVVPATAAGTYTASVAILADSNYTATNNTASAFSLTIAQSAPLVTVAISRPVNSQNALTPRNSQESITQIHRSCVIYSTSAVTSLADPLTS